MGIRSSTTRAIRSSASRVASGDVVILPAFGVSVPELQHLKSKQCVLVDTTCGSVLNVWKKVHYYARDGYTVIITASTITRKRAPPRRRR
jgi:4-hydroxy-3-methylbut-2-enyl diphosphate reductase